MSITERQRCPPTAEEMSKKTENFARRPYSQPRIHQDKILGPILCASQGSGDRPDAGGPPCPPWLPNC